MFTNAQVYALVSTVEQRLDTRLVAIEARIAALAPTSTPAPVATVAASPVASAADALASEGGKVKVTCATHGKTFAQTPAGSPTGSGFHATWCKAGFTA